MWTVIILLAFSRLIYTDPNVSCCNSGYVYDDYEEDCYNAETNITSAVTIKCTGRLLPFSEETLKFRVYNATGNLVLILDGAEAEVENGKFCIANETANETERLLVLCQEDEEPATVDDFILGYCMIISVVFLVLTCGIYGLLPEIRDLQGKSIIHFCLSLAVGLGILSIMKLMEYENMALCAVRGFLMYFFILASFFWTNAISIQILLNIKRPLVSDFGWTPFIWYALYAWGCPGILTICMAIVNFHPGDHKKPGIGLNHCWFYNTTQQWYYMYSVTTILIVVNICIFIYISIYVWRQSFSSSHTKALKYKFLMTVRMFIVMGIPWVFEMISSLSPPHIFWKIIDIFNLLQGPLLFLVLVVFRRRVIKALYRRGYLDCISGPIEKHLAVADDEEDVVQHTTDVQLK